MARSIDRVSWFFIPRDWSGSASTVSLRPRMDSVKFGVFDENMHTLRICSLIDANDCYREHVIRRERYRDPAKGHRTKR